MESALDVEALVGVAAIENAFVAADLLGNMIEGLDQPQTELLALLVLGDGNVFDVSDGTEAVNTVDKRACQLISTFHGSKQQPRVGGYRLGSLNGAGGKTYNLCSTINAPVATTELSLSVLFVSSITTM